MTKTSHGFFGPRVRDIGAYNCNSSSTTPFSIDSYLTIVGVYHATQHYLQPINALMTENRRWTGVTTQVNGNLADGVAQQFISSSSTEVGGVCVGYFLSYVEAGDVGPPDTEGDEVQIRLSRYTTTHGTTTTKYDVGAAINILIETNGSTIKVWINGDLEFEIADSTHWSTLYLCNPTNNTFTHRWWHGAMRGGSSGADRPSATPGSVDVAAKSCPTGDYDVARNGNNQYGGKCYDGGENTGATDTTLTDSGKSWITDVFVGKTVLCNGKTMTVTSNTATVLTGTGGWSGGGNPGSPHDYGVGSIENCTVEVGPGSWRNWADYGQQATHDSDVSFNCLGGGNAGREISTMSPVAVDRVPDGVTCRLLSQTNATPKTVATYTIIQADDGSESDAESANANILWTTAWRVLNENFNAPPIGTWAQYLDSNDIFNGTTGTPSTYKLSLGVRSLDSNGANDRFTAAFFEVGSMDDWPEEVTGVPTHAYDYRRRRIAA